MWDLPITTGWLKSKLLIFSKYVNKTEKIGQLLRKWSIAWYFHVKYLLHNIVLCINIIWLKAVNDITADYTTRQLRKHGVIKVCSIEYLTIEIELMLPTFKSWTKVLDHSRNYIEYLTLGLLSSHRNIYHSKTAYFFEPPCSMFESACARVYLKRWFIIRQKQLSGTARVTSARHSLTTLVSFIKGIFVVTLYSFSGCPSFRLSPSRSCWRYWTAHFTSNSRLLFTN